MSAVKIAIAAAVTRWAKRSVKRRAQHLAWRFQDWRRARALRRAAAAARDRGCDNDGY